MMSPGDRPKRPYDRATDNTSSDIPKTQGARDPSSIDSGYKAESAQGEWRRLASYQRVRRIAEEIRDGTHHAGLFLVDASIGGGTRHESDAGAGSVESARSGGRR